VGKGIKTPLPRVSQVKAFTLVCSNGGRISTVGCGILVYDVWATGGSRVPAEEFSTCVENAVDNLEPGSRARGLPTIGASRFRRKEYNSRSISNISSWRPFCPQISVDCLLKGVAVT